MNTNYNSVPNIIADKDLDYLIDMFNYNYGAYKSNINAVNNVTDEEIKTLLNKVCDIFYENMNFVINILNNEVNNG